MNIRAAPSEEEKEVGNAEGGDGVESLGVGEESGVASEEAHIAGAEWTFVHLQTISGACAQWVGSNNESLSAASMVM